ncbi:hypothetical protein F4604DRAFT_1500435, partial [Suillus subluteus]
QDRQNIFTHFDRDCFDSIERNELRDTFCQFTSEPHVVRPPSLPFSCGIIKASNVASIYGVAPGITFDRFVRACVVIKQLSGAFQGFGTDNDGWVQIS